MNHTPGPWTARPHELPSWKVCHSGSEFGIVCLTSHGNDESNAALIAAAPDLLAACKATVAAYESHQLYDKCPLDQLKRAIDKATRSPTVKD